MHKCSALPLAAAAATSARPGAQNVQALDVSVSSLIIYACPKMTTITYSQSIPDRAPFPTTEVGLCYDDTLGFLHINFTAYEEQYFYYNPTHTTSRPIFQYEVTEAFILRGTDDPQFYFEFEVSPNNIIWQGFIYNPFKVRDAHAPMDRFMVEDIYGDGLVGKTTLDQPAQSWNSYVQVPLGFFNIDQGKAWGTDWRMNFFRVVESNVSFPTQIYGAWSPPDRRNFHMTPYFGHVRFE